MALTETATPSWLQRLLHAKRELVLLVAIVLIGGFFALSSPYFLTVDNLTTTLRNSVDLAIISAGMTLVIISGSIDVSVGGVLAVAAIFVGRGFQWGLPAPAVVLLGLGVGTLLGLVNGTVVAKAKVPPIIATLGTMYVFLAVLFLVIGGEWISGLPDTLSPLVSGDFLGLPVPLYLIAGVYGVCYLLLRHHSFGRHLYAIGSNEHAARLAGIAVDRVKMQVYALLGFLAGSGALIYVARLRNVEVNIGTTIALEAIAAVILGGANIRGGVGSLLGALLGVLFIKMIQNGLVLIGVSSLWETVVIGGLLIVVLTADALKHGGPQRAQ
ncbi:ABC transporter permease [Rhodovibrio salinarum]|uniref:ABC transporter permease n=1 Tax=Rhodovibrio salinarum TaxID=1087 RepID=A0A934QGH6_9PROT|nr:ABC transporter permease [Rhodovibrio salinarum]MBK1696212.1 ABC transporter permease [Rhodovibrio salinarum]